MAKKNIQNAQAIENNAIATANENVIHKQSINFLLIIYYKVLQM